MTLPSTKVPQSPLRWDEGGVPYSTLFDDKYFCTRNGYADARHVFCDGNDLTARFKELDPSAKGVFTIGETGFGTGLDFCAARQLWEECAPASWSLHFVSLERYPLSVEDIERALAPWSALALQGRDLLARYSVDPSGMLDVRFEGSRVRLTVIFDDVVPALERLKRDAVMPKGADAWFLDGFAPSRNPEMWTPEVFAGVAQLSRAGTTFATFTVAGHVRRGLDAAGFDVRRVPGYAGKRNILTGTFRSRGA
jgi:tRNA 5-methylaminomethyl-2-thiouridine biosynthesis bifunctional protein